VCSSRSLWRVGAPSQSIPKPGEIGEHRRLVLGPRALAVEIFDPQQETPGARAREAPCE